MFRSRQLVSTQIRDWLNKKRISEIDYMEYATDGAAQAAYVSDGGYTPDLIPEMTSNSTPSPYVASASSELVSPAYAAYKAMADDGSGISQVWITNETSSGWLKIDLGLANATAIKKYTVTSGASALDGAERAPKDWTLQGSNNDSDWDTLDTVTGETSWGEPETRSFTFSNDTVYRYYKLNITDNNGNAYLCVGEFELMGISLQCYSENTIKQQGSYSLKGMAIITDSLNETLTRTVSPTIDLTDINLLKFDIRASRTGSNIKIGLHDSGGTTTEITPNILSADAFQTVLFDLSAVSNANKDNLDSIIITIVNADATNTFYIDNFIAVKIFN